jgi:hypothetical protein
MAKAKSLELAESGQKVARRRKGKVTLTRPSLLDKRVAQYGIPMWPGEATFARILVYRIPDKAASRKTFVEGGIVEMIDTTKSNEEFRSPRGIIVSAGLQAMDILRGNGMQLGEMIWMSSHTPWRFKVDTRKNGSDVEFFFMQAGDVTLSEDLLASRKAGKVRVELRDGKHQLTIADECVPRFDPPSHPDDM